jgi:putative endonuclease
MNKWSVYIVQCSDGSYYCGISKDVTQRVATHNSGRGAKYTKSRRPVVLRYVEEVGSVGQALKREREVKGYSRKKKESLFKGE